MYDDKTTRTIVHFRRLLLFSGAFNIVLAAPLIPPSVYEWYLEFLWKVNSLLGLGGVRPLPLTEGIYALFVNTAGIDLVLIGAIVLYSAFDPVKRIAIPALNAGGRTLFAGIVVYYCVSRDVMGLILVIGIIDVLISCGFMYFIVKLKWGRLPIGVNLDRAD